MSRTPHQVSQQRMVIPDSFLCGRMNVSIRAQGSCTAISAAFLPLELRTPHHVMHFFERHVSITLGGICDFLKDNLNDDEPPMYLRRPTSEWCVFVRTSQSDGVNDYDEYKMLSKDIILLQIHPYILENFRLVISMTPEYERATERIVAGEATPAYLVGSAMINSNWKMNRTYKDICRQIRSRRRRDERTRNGQCDINVPLDHLDDNMLRDNLQFFEKVKSIAISLHNNREYTESVRLFHPLNGHH